ncbi:hypothetical protein AAHA92_24917 [Salvia divinorum]|uniref:Uncharacterized protein n=1 Tax=Salvia divinorum TaxID=28513 RepID=A0ABD1G8X7_SALDI
MLLHTCPHPIGGNMPARVCIRVISVSLFDSYQVFSVLSLHIAEVESFERFDFYIGGLNIFSVSVIEVEAFLED